VTTSRDLSDPPHAQVEPALRRRGGFFLDGGRDPDTGAIVGPAWVQWEAPAEPADWLAPVVLVHGGGGQATDWMWAVDGQPGWADHFVEAGHPTYLVDRTGHGRSVWDPRTLGDRAPVPSTSLLADLFQLDESDVRPGERSRWAAVGASSTGLLFDSDDAQRRDADHLITLMGRLGACILVSHSAGAPSVWVAADARPELVTAVVAVEPLGPPYGGERHGRAMSAGLTAAPLSGGLAQVPTLVVTAAASGHRDADRATAAFLAELGVPVDHVELDRIGLHGDGHGVILDRHSTACFHLVHPWCTDVRRKADHDQP
jgi:pimeloyl-ACP methyl ester carboxylesterase